MDILELINIEGQQNQSKKHKCTAPNCNKAFGRRSDLVRHVRIHTNERPYVCDEDGCGKSFIQRSALKVHMRTHSGERPHVCEYAECGKSFSDSSSLARHRRIHTGRRPYKCRHEGCNKSFAHKTVLTKHMKSAHGSTTSKRSQIQWRPFEAPRSTIELPPSPVPSLTSPCAQRDMTPVSSSLPSPIPSPYTLSNESFFGYYERPSFSPTCQIPPPTTASSSTGPIDYPRRPSFFDIVF
ncbi:hypothetical protein VTP01DRAFT_1037 [Rhizomucor pusillus]|uniref:uncharacterized protein n=1 Tax=Rhizomucor pusillus TaxID=4840 RepID=UPI0037439B4F